MKILFISHDASLSGAPLVLLNFLKWLKKNRSEVAFDIFFLSKGHYVPTFRELAPVFVPDDYTLLPFLKRIYVRLFKDPYSYCLDLEVDKLKTQQYDIIFCNTVLTLGQGIKMKKFFPTAKLVCHLHELNGIIRLYSPSFRQQLPFVDKFVAVSKSVFENLVSNYDIPSEKISQVYEFIEDYEKEEKKTNSDEFVVGGAGLVHWRKGHDLFLLVADRVINHYRKTGVRFCWVGKMDDFHKIILEEDIRKLGLQQYIRFVGETSSPFDYYTTFSLFLMTSREDPFPLVCIEQAVLATPIVCFQGAGGTEEMLAEGGGVVVPYMNIDEMAKVVIKYFENPAMRQTHGEILKNTSQNYLTSKMAPILYNETII